MGRLQQGYARRQLEQLDLLSDDRLLASAGAKGMLLKRETLRGIRDGSISLVFRRWRRPTVKSGGTQLTAVGQLAIESVEVVKMEDVTEAEATAAGFADLASLRSNLEKRGHGDVYRIRVSLAGPDPRIALRDAIPDDAELERLRRRLARFDARSADRPWTRRTLQLIRDRPEQRAADLARDIGADRDAFKANVRKLKRLGLTESLAVGYRISSRGLAVLRYLDTLEQKG